MLQALPKSYICSKWKLREKIIRWPAFFVILRRLVQEFFFFFFSKSVPGLFFSLSLAHKDSFSLKYCSSSESNYLYQDEQGQWNWHSEAWMPTIRQHDNRQRTAEGSFFSSHNANNALDRNPPNMSEICDTPITNNHGGTNSSTQ